MKCDVKSFSKITAILRGYSYEQVDATVGVLCDSIVSAVEITLNRRDSKDIIARIAKKYGNVIAIGAGTVLSEQDLQDVVSCGADFVLAPNMFSKPMLEYCKKHKVLSVPGAFSPTEIYQCIRDGADIVKIFPARTVGSLFFKDIQAPFGKLPLMAVGGINAQNIREFFQAGTSFTGIASGLFHKEDICQKNIAGMEASLKIFEQEIEGIQL